MKILMRVMTSSFLLITAISALGYFLRHEPKFKSMTHDLAYASKKSNPSDKVLLKLHEKASLIKEYASAKGFNTARCFMADMNLASGRERFFIYNLQKDSVEKAGLVSHGSGSDRGEEDLYFSNTPNSNCTSLGKYRIGRSYMGKFGLAYKLYGLDSTNNKSFERFVVLHALSCVPNEDIDPVPLCQSWGCPTVSPDFLQELKKYIDASERPILLWIYY
jgi:L,D-transpeptidase catalytic domain